MLFVLGLSGKGGKVGSELGQSSPTGEFEQKLDGPRRGQMKRQSLD